MYISFLPTEYIKSRIDSQQRISDPLFSFPTEPKDKLREGEIMPAYPVYVGLNVHQIILVALIPRLSKGLIDWLI